MSGHGPLDPEIIEAIHQINSNTVGDETEIDEDVLEEEEETPVEPTSEPRFRRRRAFEGNTPKGARKNRRPRLKSIAAGGACTLVVVAVGLFLWPSSEPDSKPELSVHSAKAAVSRATPKISFVDFVTNKANNATTADQARTRRWRVVPAKDVPENNDLIDLADDAELTLDTEEREHVHTFLSDFFDLFLNLVKGAT